MAGLLSKFFFCPAPRKNPGYTGFVTKFLSPLLLPAMLRSSALMGPELLLHLQLSRVPLAMQMMMKMRMGFRQKKCPSRQSPIPNH